MLGPSVTSHTHVRSTVKQSVPSIHLSVKLMFKTIFQQNVLLWFSDSYTHSKTLYPSIHYLKWLKRLIFVNVEELGMDKVEIDTLIQLCKASGGDVGYKIMQANSPQSFCTSCGRVTHTHSHKFCVPQTATNGHLQY